MDLAKKAMDETSDKSAYSRMERTNIRQNESLYYQQRAIGWYLKAQLLPTDS